MRVVVPGIVQVDEIACVIVSEAEHAMPRDLDEHRPPGFDFCLVHIKGEAQGWIAAHTFYELEVVRDHAVAARLGK